MTELQTVVCSAVKYDPIGVNPFGSEAGVIYTKLFSIMVSSNNLQRLAGIALLLTVAFINLCSCKSDEIIGCGGFILAGKAGTLDLSRVEIKLYTKQGSLKYQTDCAPNNGYYFIPIYDKGEYTIKVAPPKGWIFTPSEQSINIDGSTDACTTGKDINFELQGYSIQGHVSSHGRTTGPSGVKVELYIKDSASLLQTTESNVGGAFQFPNVLPGSYRIRASHPKWKLDVQELDVTVKDDSVLDASGLRVQGYDVSGRVISEGEPMQGVTFTVYAENSIPGYCGVEKPSSDQEERDGLAARCQTVSNEKGEFTFPTVVPGGFLLVPTYKGENIQFDIKPSSVKFEVTDDGVVLSQTFEVQGFRVSGHVYQNNQGKGVSGARVYLNGEQVAVTDASGAYYLENVRTGTYTLKIQSDLFGFAPLTVRIGPNTPHLPDIVALSYRVCGKINYDSFPSTVSRSSRQVIFIPEGEVADSNEPTLTSVSSSGEFCELLKPGQYKLEPMILETERSAGLQLGPLSHDVVVVDTPLSGFEFTQFRASIRGSVRCLGSCGTLTVQLSGNQISSRTQSTSSQFEFEDLFPGKYSLTILKDAWCWKESSISVEIRDHDVNDVEFQQSGYYVTLVTSHDTDVVAQTSDFQETLKLRKGTSKHCLEKPGTYTFQPKSCHVFAPESAQFSTSSPSVITFTAVKHRVSFQVKADTRIDDLVIEAITSEGSRNLETSHVTESAGKAYHQFSVYARPGEVVELIPKAESLLFFPEKVSLTVKGDCEENAAEIVAQRGLFLSGAVTPPIADVDITIRGGNLKEPEIVRTDDNGQYSFGPVNKDGFSIDDLASTFQISAEKKGYVLKPSTHFGDFVAEKLAEIIVAVIDDSGSPLPGVLVTVAGGVNNRFNSQTGPDGKVVFSGLNPGDFFVKPVLKEYKFDPTSKMVRVEDGASVSVAVRGERTAYSCYGVLTSLNGEAEAGIIMEAVGVGENCNEYQEEGVTESSGQFRIRGLLPQCEYIVKLRTYEGANKKLERTLPSSITVKVSGEDVRGLHFAAIKAINQADVAVTIETPSRDYLKSLKLKLFREDEPDSAVHVIRVDNSALIMLPVLPMDGRRYFVQLESNLPRATFDYHKPEVSFTANVSAQHVVIRFDPVAKTPDTDSAQVSITGVVFLLLCAAAAYNYEKVGLIAGTAFSQLAAWIAASGKTSTNNSPYQGSPSNPMFSEKELALIESSTKKKPKPKKT